MQKEYKQNLIDKITDSFVKLNENRQLKYENNLIKKNRHDQNYLAFGEKSIAYGVKSILEYYLKKNSNMLIHADHENNKINLQIFTNDPEQIIESIKNILPTHFNNENTQHNKITKNYSPENICSVNFNIKYTELPHLLDDLNNYYSKINDQKENHKQSQNLINNMKKLIKTTYQIRTSLISNDRI